MLGSPFQCGGFCDLEDLQIQILLFNGVNTARLASTSAQPSCLHPWRCTGVEVSVRCS